MTIPSVPAPSSPPNQLGGWLFRHRTSLPIPVVLALLLIRVGEAPLTAGLLTAGLTAIAFGEGLRVWGVHHIGAISRTRSDRLGPLVTSGPFGRVRNPLYIGNIALWVGFALCARLVWMAPVILVLLGLEYHAIVRWEEGLLESRRGDDYRAYMSRVPRWLPSLRSINPDGAATGYSWRETLFSERGTLIAIAVGFGLLWAKAAIWGTA